MLALTTHRPGVIVGRMTKPPAVPPRLTEREALGQAIKRLRRAADLTQDAAAEALGVQPNSWRRYEWGERGLNVEKLGEIASAIGTTREAIIAEAERLRTGAAVLDAARPATVTALRPRAAPAAAGLAVRERVQAGGWFAVDDPGEALSTFPAVADPRYPHADQWLAEVVGDDVAGLGVFPGDLAHCVDAAAIGYAPRTGDLVEVERLQFGGQLRELSLRQVEATPDGVRLWARSSNPRHAEPLDLEPGAGDTQIRIRAQVIAAIRRF